MPMTQAQRDFIVKYIADNNLGRLRGKIANAQYEKFARRFNKAKDALDALPAGHASLALLKPQLDAAKTDAEQGNFRHAYRTLDSIKTDAKLAANGYISAITAGTLRTEIDPLLAAIEQSKSKIDEAIADCDAFMDQFEKSAIAADNGDLTDALAFLKGFARQEPTIKFEYESLTDILTQRSATAVSHDVLGQIPELKRKVKLVENEGRMGEISEQVAKLIKIERLSKEAEGLYVKRVPVTKMLNAYKARFDKRMAEVKALDSFQSKEDWESMKFAEVMAMFDHSDKTVDLMFKDTEDNDLPDQATLTHTQEPDGEGGMRSVFKRLYDEEQMRVQRALDQMAAAKARDAALSDGQHTKPTYEPAVPEELETFDMTAGPMAAALTHLPAVVGDAEIKSRTDAVEKAITDYMSAVDTKDEAYLDLLLKSRDEIERDIAIELGVPEDAGARAPEHNTLVKAMADTMAAKILEKSPNKMADDLQSISVGGVDYVLDKVLGGGANGTARRFISADGTQSIVVKSLDNQGADQADRGPMVKEMQSHARLLKGDTKESKAAVADMKGAAVSEDGALHMVMADAGGADLRKVTNSLMMMEKVGVIPPEARQAMAQNLIRQTIDGLKLMEEKNLIHNDLKPENIIMGSDGKVRIIDFGESLFGDAKGEEPSAGDGDYAVSQVYKAPEQGQKGAPVTKGVDTYALGGIIKALGGHAGENPMDRGQFGVRFEASAPKDTLSAIDRAASAAMDPASDKRPSLDAIAASSYLAMGDEAHRDFVPEDIADLTAAAANFQGHLSKVTCQLPAENYPGAVPETISMEGVQVKVSFHEENVVKLQIEIEESKAAGEEPRSFAVQMLKHSTDTLDMLRGKRDEAMDQTRKKGDADYKALLDDPANTVDYGDGTKTIADALKAHEKILKKASKLRGGFYRIESRFKTFAETKTRQIETLDGDDRLMAEQEKADIEAEYLEQVAEVNTRLKAYSNAIAQIKGAIDAALADKLTPEAKFTLAEARLKEVGSRFGTAISSARPAPRGAPPSDDDKFGAEEDAGEDEDLRVEEDEDEEDATEEFDKAQ